MHKYNDPTEGKATIGSSAGDPFPPGSYVSAFQKGQEGTSKNKKTGTVGQPQFITEWNIADVVRRDYDPEKGYRNWDGRVLTAEPGARRSYVMKMHYPNAINDLNELVVLLHGVDSKSPAALRAAGLVPTANTAAEHERVAHVLNGMIARVLSEANPFLDYVLALDVVESINPVNNHTFMRHVFTLVRDPAAVAHNQAILAKIK